MSDIILPLDKSVLYNKITPIVLISLSSLYISILIFRYFKWRYRKRKAKKMRMDRQKLERFWRKRAVRLDIEQLQKPSASYHTAVQQSPSSFESSATLVVSAGDPLPHTKEHDSSSYNNEKQQQQEQGRHKKRADWVDKVANRLDGNHQKKKRRQLLWQWSVAMGYCRYNHGHHLNTMINRLLENHSTSSSSSSSNNSTVDDL